MLRMLGILSACLVCLLLLGSIDLARSGAAAPRAAAPSRALAVTPVAAAPQPVASAVVPPPAPPPPSPPEPRAALEDGVLIVVSLASQKMFVFRQGALWGTSPVSTGRRGYATPAGLFPILQKKVYHRSTTYENAPMPYMQRLTWGGVALHAGRVPRYPASHGCIRLPHAFARALYGITNHTSTAVLVVGQPVRSAEQARRLGGGEAAPPVLVREEATVPAQAGYSPRNGPSQTIQLAASSNPQQAAALWHQLVAQRPELARLGHQIIPATVNAREVFRLRASGADAHAICNSLQRSGNACLKVPS